MSFAPVSIPGGPALIRFRQYPIRLSAKRAPVGSLHLETEASQRILAQRRVDTAGGALGGGRRRLVAPLSASFPSEEGAYSRSCSSGSTSGISFNALSKSSLLKSLARGNPEPLRFTFAHGLVFENEGHGNQGLPGVADPLEDGKRRPAPGSQRRNNDVGV